MFIYQNILQKSKPIILASSYRYNFGRFFASTINKPEIELNYLDKPDNGIAVIGIQRPAAKNALRYDPNENYY